MEAIRRQAEGAEKKRKEIFDRIRALPASPAPDPAAQRPAPAVLLRAFPEPAAPLVIMQAMQAQEDDDPDQEAPPQPMIMVPRKVFDQLVFGSAGNDASRLAWLDTRLKTRIELADRESRLTDSQKEKLRLAGRGDIKRFLDRVAKECGEPGGSDMVGMSREEYVKFRNELQALRDTYHAGPFYGDSLFSKALRTIRADGSSTSHQTR
jgi:hypothetical protein